MAFIDGQWDEDGLEPICSVLPTAPSTFHEAKARDRDPGREPTRARRDPELKVAVRRAWAENFRVRGTMKPWR